MSPQISPGMYSDTTEWKTHLTLRKQLQSVLTIVVLLCNYYYNSYHFEYLLSTSHCYVCTYVISFHINNIYSYSHFTDSENSGSER